MSLSTFLDLLLWGFIVGVVGSAIGVYGAWPRNGHVSLYGLVVLGVSSVVLLAAIVFFIMVALTFEPSD